MNLEPTTEQVAIGKMAAQVSDRMAIDSTGLRREQWKQLGDLGMLGLVGAGRGADLGPIEASIVAEEFGAALVPGPAIWSDVVGSFIPEVAEGSVVVTGYFAHRRTVSYLEESDRVIVISADSASLVDADRIHAVSSFGIDPSWPVSRVVSEAAGSQVATGDHVRDLIGQVRLLAASQLVGVARRALHVTVEYAKQREQFGRPIGSFQAIKHLLADVHTAVEFAKSQVLFSAVARADGNDRSNDASRSALVVSERAALNATRAAIQVHGGMGFAAETQCHLLYKRVLAIQEAFGGARQLTATH